MTPAFETPALIHDTAPEVGGGAGGGAGQLHTDPQNDLGGSESEGLHMSPGEVVVLVSIISLFLVACTLLFCYKARCCRGRRRGRGEGDDEEGRSERDGMEPGTKGLEAEPARGRRVVEHISVLKLVNGRSVDEPGRTAS